MVTKSHDLANKVPNTAIRIEFGAYTSMFGYLDLLGNLDSYSRVHLI